MTLLADVVAAADPALAGHAAAEPGRGRFEELDATPARRFNRNAPVRAPHSPSRATTAG